MRLCQIEIKNFRGVKDATLLLPDHVIFVGDNNIGKSTILEAIDLVLGPDRASRKPVIDEHDFYAGEYLKSLDTQPELAIELIVINLSEEQTRHFQDHLEWWDQVANKLIQEPPPETIEGESVIPALRLAFSGKYDEEEDDFIGETFFCSPLKDDDSRVPFRKSDKQKCGFLYLRTLRTGSRALSLERGSLLDIILRLKETRVQMWEQVLEQLRTVSVAEDPTLGLSETLSSVQAAIRTIVPADWGSNPQLRVSELTREALRSCLSIFMSTGARNSKGVEYSAPFQHQGTGTINTLVLSMLSLIADLKQNVIFAMEEPEIAIPPHTQKRIINSIRSKSSQSLFTSHSPYVLEEATPSQIIVLHSKDGRLTGTPATFPDKIKPKLYRSEFRKRYCEALLARRVLIVEGNTEYDAMTAAARKLNELDCSKYKTIEELGISIVNAESDSQIAPIAKHLRDLGKEIFAVFDKQEKIEQLTLINQNVHHAFQSDEKSFENLILNHTSESALRRFAKSLIDGNEWPQHLAANMPNETSNIEGLKSALYSYFAWSKASGTAADLLSSCAENEMPKYIVSTIAELRKKVEFKASASEAGFETDQVAEGANGTE